MTDLQNQNDLETRRQNFIEQLALYLKSNQVKRARLEQKLAITAIVCSVALVAFALANLINALAQNSS
jgi:multisubunit Na+/H+ antiporter MnhC subunit